MIRSYQPRWLYHNLHTSRPSSKRGFLRWTRVVWPNLTLELEVQSGVTHRGI